MSLSLASFVSASSTPHEGIFSAGGSASFATFAQAPAVRADVAVKDGAIAEVGRLSGAAAYPFELYRAFDS